ncbi:MAG: hypothetical protein A2X45_18745 [Lentisphaerae bacterium GWF2_50_93]|nr:MAG: hypothetical protein A2X45_18745 [Lentisphaerae bacterium GWF2_50_93]
MDYTVQNIIDVIMDSIPQAVRTDTVDTIKIGDPGMKVSGIVSTFIITMDVIRKAESLGANLIITHEPTYYDHRDEVEKWLKDDPVVAKKRKMMERKKIAVWRFHDNWHRNNPDGIVTGMAYKLGWEKYQGPVNQQVFTRDPITLKQLADELKKTFNLKTIRVIGRPEQKIRQIGLTVGAYGGDYQVKFLSKHGDVDTLVCGETVEWQTGEYIRDATLQGREISLVILGHVLSEQEGMNYLVEWLRPKVPGLPIHYVEVPDLFSYL